MYALDKPWKVAERRAAKALGGKRNPLSGSNSQHTAGDIIHPRLYAEVKYRKRFAVSSLMEDTRKKAKAEGKIPIVVLQEAGRKSSLFVVDSRDLDRVVEELHNASTQHN